MPLALPTLEQPAALWLLLVVPLMLVLWWRVDRQRRLLFQDWSHHSYLWATHRRWGYLLLCLLLVLVSVALAKPTWGTAPVTPVSTVRDVLVLIDVSRSMLAEDQPPRNRLQRSKEYLLELVDNLRTSTGRTRIGLVVFAGQVRLLCPPTEDLEHLTYQISELDTESLGMLGRTLQHQGVVIGTSLAAAIHWLKSWIESQPETASSTDLLLITDGDEQTTEAEVLQSAQGIPAFDVLLVGDTRRGWPIPEGTGSLMKVDPASGQVSQVLSQANEVLLQHIVDATGGSLVRESNPQPLVTWWQRTVQPQPGRPVTSQVRHLPIDQSGWLLSLGLIILLVEITWGGPRRVIW